MSEERKQSVQDMWCDYCKHAHPAAFVYRTGIGTSMCNKCRSSGTPIEISPVDIEDGAWAPV